MTDLLTRLNTLKRPRLLINAARFGMSDYRRDIHLARHLGERVPSDVNVVLRQLMEIEHGLNHERETRTASYSVARHVEVMIAMMSEARLLRQSAEAAPLDRVLQ